MKILIPGGAGYIGSHMVKYAQDHDHEVTVLDDFSTGHEWAIKDCEVLEVNLLDQQKLESLLKGRFFDVVIHFAAKSIVSESTVRPNFYFYNNVVGSLNLFNEMLKNDINNIVFSSTAAIFGNPMSNKIDENHLKNPINPYGRSKLIIENMLEDFVNAYNFNAICLRYFNAAGADASGDIGEAHDPETHLIPNVITSAINKNDTLEIYGNDYDTPDGTCIRDYVHVEDLAQAHLLSIDYMKKTKGFSSFNLGNGNGFSVMDVIKSCEKAASKKLKYKIKERREGDPPILVAESLAAKNTIGWKPKYAYIDDIVTSAWKWHKSQIKS